MKEIIKTVSVVAGSNLGMAAVSATAVKSTLELALLAAQVLVALTTAAYVLVKIRNNSKEK